jgi:hypothetical protein
MHLPLLRVCAAGEECMGLERERERERARQLV